MGGLVIDDIGDVDLDELAGRVFRRVSFYRETGDEQILFDEEAAEEAEALWQALRTVIREADQEGAAGEPSDAGVVLGWHYYYRYDTLAGEPTWPELARAVVCFAPQSPLMPTAMGQLLGPEADHDLQYEAAMGFLARSRDADDPALLDAGIALLTPAAEAVPEGGTERGIRLTDLCLALKNRFERDVTFLDLDRAISAGEWAVATPGLEKVLPVAPRFNLSLAYWARFRREGLPTDIRRAIALLQDVAASFAPGPQRSEWLTEVARAQVALYEQGRNPAVLAQATATAEQAVADLPHEPKEAAAALFTLAEALYYGHQSSGSADDLRRARELALKCLAGHLSDPARPGFLTDVARFHLRLHSDGLNPDDLRTAIELSERAAGGRPRNPAALPVLVMALEARYRQAGASGDLDRAILLAGQAVDDGSADPTLLAALASVSLTRHQHAGVLGDLEHAIAILRELLLDVEGTRAQRAGWATLLGSAYQQRFVGAHDLADLRRAIEFGEQGVAGTSATDPGLGGRLSRLAIAYQYGHDVGADPSYRARAIELGERAVAVTPQGDPDRASWLSNLANAYLTAGYTAVPTRADIDRAVELSEEALAVHPAQHAEQVRVVANLATAYRDLAIAGGPVDDARVGDLARRVTQTDAVPVDRVWGRHAVGLLAQVKGDYRLATELLDAAVELLPDVAPQEAQWADQQYRLGEHMGLVSSAVAAHCAADDPAGAVAVAELGRGVVLARQAETRAQRTRPDLANLRGAAEGGFVVLVNASRYRGDAVIVRADADPVLVHLPRLELKEVEERAIALEMATSAPAGSASDDETPVTAVLRRQRELQEILGWLWDVIAAPVLAALPDEPSPHRIWWLPVGFLSVFPLHAAGHPGQDGVLDLAVSSYIPTLGTLGELRSRAAPAARRQLVVGLQHTPGLPDLPGTADEAADLHARHHGSALLDDQATADRVTTALKETTWAHFACHAQADLLSPADGGLWLHDGLLRLPEIGALRLPHAELAYLSACSTAFHGGRTADEALHLGSAFHLAGFRHVIASLWPLDDRAAAEAARTFYHGLPDTPAATSAATELHQVTRMLRAASPTRPDLWAALIHSGP
jgi:tetratricopeptide (TPR) repeat protein